MLISLVNVLILISSFISLAICKDNAAYPTSCWNELVRSKQSTQLARITPFCNSICWTSDRGNVWHWFIPVFKIK